MEILELTATVLTLISVYCMTNKRVQQGWVYGISGNMCWLVFGAYIASYGIITTNLVMFVLYLRSIIKEVY
jgi:hypothetical protein